jgi:TrmH family RNA methyltransferase
LRSISFDPGNLGTILRLCDWFGVEIYIKETDIYNPKVVQATMGSIGRVNVNYIDLEHFIAEFARFLFYGRR